MKEDKVPWFASSYRANLIDMHIPDWDDRFLAAFDPREYIEMICLSQVDTAYIYTSSCLGIANWPTIMGHMHNGLKGRDIIRELVQGLRSKGIRVVLDFNYWS